MKITFKDSVGETIPNVTVFQNSRPAVNSDINGIVNIPKGEYTAVMIGYIDKNFVVNGIDGTVTMLEKNNILNEVTITGERKKDYTLLIFLIVIVLIYAMK